MNEQKKYLTDRYKMALSLFHNALKTSFLILLTAFMSDSTTAATYTAYPGSSVVVKSVAGKMTGPTSNITLSVSPLASWYRPLLGGLVTPDKQAGYACLLSWQVKKIDGRTGVTLSSNNILAGITGTIKNGVAHYQLPNATERTRVTGGLSFSQFGAATPMGDADPGFADLLCGSVPLVAHTTLSNPGNGLWGNLFADLDLQAWLYVPLSVEPGTYTLSMAGIAQGSSGSNSPTNTGYIPIINSGDTVEVLAPPCTISTPDSIIFDTTTEEGMKVNAPVTFKCGQLEVPSRLEAFLQVRPLGTTSSSTEMNLTINGSQPGGVVRAYAGAGLIPGNANCQDNSYSISYAEAFAKSMGPLASNINTETPLIWQLCRKGNEVAGLAKGSAILSINYK